MVALFLRNFTFAQIDWRAKPCKNDDDGERGRDSEKRERGTCVVLAGEGSLRIRCVRFDVMPKYTVRQSKGDRDFAHSAGLPLCSRICCCCRVVEGSRLLNPRASCPANRCQMEVVSPVPRLIKATPRKL